MSDVLARRRSATVAKTITTACALTVLVIGLLALLAPRPFAGLINFPPYNEHLLHDVGAFEIGIAVSMLVALRWSDAIGVTLLAFILGDAIHSANHAFDRHLGGSPSDLWLLGGLGVAATVALLCHLRSTRRPAPTRGVASPTRKDTE